MRRAARRVLAVGAALVGAAALPAAVTAQSSTSATLFAIGGSPGLTTVVQIPARVRGYVEVSFHGDLVTGCAVRGLCGYSGTVLWTPAPSGSLEILDSRSHGHHHYDLYLQLQGQTGIPGDTGGVTRADVTQTQEQTLPALDGAGSAGTSCADVTSAATVIQLHGQRSRVRFSLARASPSPLTTRCAGPLLADVGPALAAPTATLSAARHGAITLDLAGSRSFASHGFAGTVDSTLTIALGRPHRPQSLSVTPPNATVREREVLVGYHAAIAGEVSAVVSGDGDQGLCAPLGACGGHEALSVVPAAGAASAQLEALGPAGRPERDFLTALGLSHGGNPHGIQIAGAVIWDGGGVVSADLQQGLASCRDSTGLGGGTVLLGSTHGRLSAVYEAGALSGGGLRTRCPGPVQSALGAVATGSAPLSILSQRSAKLTLDRGQPWLDDGYSGASTSHLTLTLTRQRTRTLLFRVPPPGI